MSVRKVEYLTAMSLKELKEKVNAFYEEHDRDHWFLVSINEGDNRSHIAWLEYYHESE